MNDILKHLACVLISGVVVLIVNRLADRQTEKMVENLTDNVLGNLEKSATKQKLDDYGIGLN